MQRAYISRSDSYPLVTDEGFPEPANCRSGQRGVSLRGSKLMKHFSIWQWTDYVRALAEEGTRSAMEAHLSSGCARCQRTVNVLRGLTAMARAEPDYEPPAHAIRYAKALYSLSQPEKVSLPRVVARLVHDSFREPLPAGLRAQNRLSRQALYEAGSYCLDLQLEQQHGSGRVTLIGQLADRNNPTTTSTAEVPVWLMKRKLLVASTHCNPFGEFQLEYAPVRDLRVCLPLRAARKRLEVSLDRLTPGLPGRPRPAKIARRKTRRRPGGG